MLTGIKVDDEIVGEFNDFKLKKFASKFIIYKIDNALGKIVTDFRGAGDATFDDLRAALPPNEGRYIVYDCDYVTSDGRANGKLVSISWIPDATSVKTKMIYAGSRDALSSVLVGVMVKMQASDNSEFNEERLREECSRF